jgi:chromosome segregation ATPase
MRFSELHIGQFWLILLGGLITQLVVAGSRLWIKQMDIRNPARKLEIDSSQELIKTLLAEREELVERLSKIENDLIDERKARAEMHKDIAKLEGEMQAFGSKHKRLIRAYKALQQRNRTLKKRVAEAVETFEVAKDTRQLIQSIHHALSA